jgi:hypothetical protein
MVELVALAHIAFRLLPVGYGSGCNRSRTAHRPEPVRRLGVSSQLPRSMLKH